MSLRSDHPSYRGEFIDSRTILNLGLDHLKIDRCDSFQKCRIFYEHPDYSRPGTEAAGAEVFLLLMN